MIIVEVEWVGVNKMELIYLVGLVYLYNWWGYNKIISFVVFRLLR